MTRLLLLLLWTATAWAQSSLRGMVTDPSGAAVPNAVVQVTGPAGEKRVKTGLTGQYSFPRLAAGKYRIRVTAKGFSVAQKKDFAIDGAAVFDASLIIQTEAQNIHVEGRSGGVGTEPDSNGSAVVMNERQIAAFSDDPDELALELQALAGPAPGPNGGQMYIDGFSGGSLPPKSSIREVRINSNPYSPEFDRPGFARVDIFTKAGSDTFHGQAMTQQNSDALNSRNPLMAQSTRTPYRAQLYGFNIGGPVKKNKASFTLDLERRKIGENAFILATTLDADLNLVKLNQTLATPQSRTVVSPRLDYALTNKNNLAVRYQQICNGLDNLGAGDFSLASRAYHETQREQSAQVTDTDTVSPRTINETRFQYLRSTLWDAANVNAPAIDVVGAFSGGAAPVGSSGAVTGNWELSNITIYTRGKHTLKWGGRARESRLTDTSLNNFAGTFTFYTLAQYQAGIPAQFSRNAGSPATQVNQADLGLFGGDDWRVRSNLTVSFGVRYETQSNWGGHLDFAPRMALAWSRGKTVLRVGVGSFYDRIPPAITLNQLRYNGLTQQSYLILNPAFFPLVPSPEQLAAERAPQELRPVAAGLAAARLYQASAGIERQLNPQSRMSLTWIESRGVHLPNSRNINAPLGGLYPFGDPFVRLLAESSGVSRQRQLVANANVTWRRLFLFGFYALSYGQDDNEGLPADPYNLRAEWGPSSYGDVRHRVAMGATVLLPGKLSVSPFLVANSGLPYNITTGLDPQQTGFPEERPALINGVFQPGVPAIGRNYGRGPANVNVALRVARTWQFGREGGSGVSDGAGAGHDGPPAGMFASSATRRYQLTLSASTLNALNRANYAPPNGDLSSGYFGQYRSLGGLIVMMHGGAPTTYNRKIDLQLRFTF
jgi:Carboxypeptidase regulatory-like domain